MPRRLAQLTHSRIAGFSRRQWRRLNEVAGRDSAAPDAPANDRSLSNPLHCRVNGPFGTRETTKQADDFFFFSVRTLGSVVEFHGLLYVLEKGEKARGEGIARCRLPALEIRCRKLHCPSATYQTRSEACSLKFKQWAARSELRLEISGERIDVVRSILLVAGYAASLGVRHSVTR